MYEKPVIIEIGLHAPCQDEFVFGIGEVDKLGLGGSLGMASTLDRVGFLGLQSFCGGTVGAHVKRERVGYTLERGNWVHKVAIGERA
jgi:hypothetical protein